MSTKRGNDFTSFAEEQFSNSGASGLYDRARPGYPVEAHQKILSLLSEKASVVELGSGTGLFTRGFLTTAQSKDKGAIAEWIAVEPSQGMRKGFADKLGELKNQVKIECVDGLFDKIPVEDGQADAVVIAQAFHWTGHDATSAITEIARVLKPGGYALFIWNMEDRSRNWVASLRDLYEEFEAGTPQYRHMYWKAVYDTSAYNDSFEKAEKAEFSQILTTNADLVVDRLLSKSYITALDDGKKASLARDVKELLEKAEDKVWIDKSQGTFEYPYTTDLYIMKRK